jgi:hypothetical protein
MTLNDLAKWNHCDKRISYELGLAHNYTPIYEGYFKDHVLEYKDILEIGVWDGRSLRMWYEYFPNARIWGIDNMNAVGCLPPEQINNDRIIYRVGSQGDENFLRQTFEGITFDFIIDDGSHQSWMHQLSFKYLFPKVKPGGLYFIEDLDTCLIREFRELDDLRSTTTAWLASIQNGQHFSYYMTDADIQNIASIEIFGELGVIHKK